MPRRIITPISPKLLAKTAKIKSVDDELRLLRHAHLKDIDLFKGILSSYVMRGQSKGSVWSDAMEQGVFLELMRRMTALFFSTNMD